jgi:hypothetical protein
MAGEDDDLAGWEKSSQRGSDRQARQTDRQEKREENIRKAVEYISVSSYY